MFKNFGNISPWYLMICFLSGLVYFYISYYLQREDTQLLFVFIGFLGIVYIYLLQNQQKLHQNYSFWVWIAFLFRILFLLCIPNLSDDYYRFIWDGKLIQNGIHPYKYLPQEILDLNIMPGIEHEKLVQHMNSPNYYSVYPLVLQIIFYTSSVFSFSSNFWSIVIMRILILMAEFGTYKYIKKILRVLNLPSTHIFWYLLNPLIIIELTGNLHFEGILIFFLLVSWHFLLKNSHVYSAIFFALSVHVKLIPLILLPLIVRKLGVKKGLIYSSVSLFFIFLLFTPLLSISLLKNMLNSLSLYFQTFEFNASIYYMLRWIGYQITGYNEIKIIGKVLPVISTVVILLISCYPIKQPLTYTMFYRKTVLVLFVYYLFSLIVHPWYISLLVVSSVFTNQRYAIIWSILVFATYSAYAMVPYQENYWIIACQYSIVIIYFFIEQKKLKHLHVLNNNSASVV